MCTQIRMVLLKFPIFVIKNFSAARARRKNFWSARRKIFPPRKNLFPPREHFFCAAEKNFSAAQAWRNPGFSAAQSARRNPRGGKKLFRRACAAEKTFSAARRAAEQGTPIIILMMKYSAENSRLFQKSGVLEHPGFLNRSKHS